MLNFKKTEHQFVISDIHGMYHEFEDLIKVWNPEKEDLIILGDLIDRGYNSLLVVQRVLHLMSMFKNIYVVKGNHEELFEYWLQDPILTHNIYIQNGGMATIDSFLEDTYKEKIKNSRRERNSEYMDFINSPVLQRDKINQEFATEIKFLTELPLYLETKHTIFVHAGVNTALSNWKETSDSDFLWLREEFYNSQNTTNKTIVFGHTPAFTIKPNQWFKNNIWYNTIENYVGIDSGAFKTKKLNAVRLTNGKVTEVITRTGPGITTKTFFKPDYEHVN